MNTINDFINNYSVVIILFLLFTVIFFFALLTAFSPKFRERVSAILPFSGKKEGSYKPPFFLVILIIIVCMVLAYFF